jgi:signal transduction histidine kinase
LVDECISEMLYVAKEKNVNIVIEDKQEQNDIEADKVQVKRVIMNLLSNGIKYAYKNSTLKIRIKVDSKKANFEFELCYITFLTT